MNTTILLDFIPRIFKSLIPTKLEVDGLEYPLHHKIELGDYSKTYGHHRLRVVFMGFIKTKTLVVDANKNSILINFKFQNKKWLYYFISIAASTYLLFSKPLSKLILIIFVFVFILLLIIDMLMFFVQIQEKHHTTNQKKGA